MTSKVYHVTMKPVGVAELKAKLSEYLRRVRQGEAVTVLDRKTPVARIVSVDEDKGRLEIRRPASDAPRPSEVPLPPTLKIASDAVELLLQERGSGR